MTKEEWGSKMHKNIRPTNFFYKLLLYFMTVSLLPIILFSFFSTFLSNKISVKKVESELKSTVEGAGINLDNLLEEYKNGLTLFCEDEEIREVLKKEEHQKEEINGVYKKMYLLLAGRTAQLDMYVIKEDNSFHVSTEKLPKVYQGLKYNQWGMFRAISESTQAIVYSNNYINEKGVEIALSVARKVMDKNQILGYAIIDIPQKALGTVLHASTSILPVDYTVMDSRYYIVFDEAFTGMTQRFLNLDFREAFIKEQNHCRAYDLKGKKVLIANNKLDHNDIIVLSTLPMDLVIQNNDYIKVIAASLGIVSILLCFIASFLIARGISRPIRSISVAMKQAENGDMMARAPVTSNDEIGDMASGLNKMIINLDELFKNNLEKQDRLRLAEIKDLHSQINPHFLYNTLDSIKWLAKLGYFEEINVVVEKLGILLKNSINNSKNIVTIEESVKIIESYLAIQKIRYDNKIKIDISIDPSIYAYYVPKLLIQPIVENAIIHGIESKIGDGTLLIRGYEENQMIIFEISDDGVGIDYEKLAQLQSDQGDLDHSIGISNTDRRIKLYYGEQYGVHIKSKVDVGTTVTVTVPVMKSEG